MSKVNYAKIRNSQKRADTNPEEKVFEPISPLEVHSSQGGSLAYGDRTPYPVTSSKIESAGLTNLFGENVVMDNLDYINSLLGNQLPGSGVPPKRKKSKQKPDDASTQPRSSDKVVSPNSPSKANNDPLNVPLNSPGLDPIPSLLAPYEIENSYLPENKDVAPVEGEEKMKWRIGRNMSNMVSAKEAEIYEEYFQNEMNSDVGKRSMSLEDARVAKRDFLRAGIVIKTTGSAQTEGEAFGDDSIHIPTDPIPSSATQDMGNGKPPKSDFSSKLGLYIDYFQKSENTQYRVRKASQYFGNTAHQVNSRTESQRSAQSKNNEQLEKMASQMKKLKAKIDDLQLTNELLSNERKTWKKKEHELLYRAENAEGELEKVHSKAKKYKEKLKYTQELLQREKLDNENNLLALRRVLANNISTVLEHKIHHYMNNDRGELHKEPQRHSASEKGGGNKKSNKDKEYRKNTSSNAHISMTNSENKGKAKRYEEVENVKNKWNNTSLKDKMSPLLSQKDQSFSDDDDDQNPPERFTTLSKSDEQDPEELVGRNRRLRGYSPRQSDYETSSELGSEFQYYFHGNHQDNSKKYQQIQHIQNQLSKLMEKDESQPYSGSHYSKANKRSIDQHISANKHRSKPQSSYSLKGANYSKTTSFSKQNEQNPRMYRKDLDDTLSPNEVLNPSFSNSESGWTTSLGK